MYKDLVKKTSLEASMHNSALKHALPLLISTFFMLDVEKHASNLEQSTYLGW